MNSFTLTRQFANLQTINRVAVSLSAPKLSTDQTTVWHFVVFVILMLIGMQPALSQTIDPKNEYFFHVADYPKDGSTPSWGDRTWAPNGITHDKANWYIASVNRWGFELGYKTKGTDWGIWRWPIKQGLDQDLDNKQKGVTTFRLSTDNTAGSIFAQYGHLGDIDHCENNGIDYLLLPLTGGGRPIIAFFRADNLSFVNYSYLPELTKNNSIGWCAFNNADSSLYTSDDSASNILQYKIDWSIVNNKHHDALQLSGSHKLERTIYNMQGGEFTPDGKLLYISSGVVPDVFPTDGITVLETVNWTKIYHSTNIERNENTCFNYNFDNSSLLGREPEGLTIWDVDGNGAPYSSQTNLTGQLHVLLDNHNWPGSPTIAVMHYKNENIRFPGDIVVKASAPDGESAMNPAIAAFLNPVSGYGNCAKVSNNAPLKFPIGKTVVTFTVTQNSDVITQYSANVTVTDQGLAPTGVNSGNSLPQKPGLAIFPNPSSGQFTISLKQPARKTSIAIFNLTGQLVYQTATAQTLAVVDLSLLSPGVYFVEITNENLQSMHRIVKR